MRRLQARALAAILCVAAACAVVGCSMNGQRWTGFGRTRHLKSFLGVPFGDSLDGAMRKHPYGQQETSPFGAPAYRLDNQDAGTVVYKRVVYEFNDSGMQLAIARFSSGDANDVLKQLTDSLGTPTSSGGTDVSDASTVHASWTMPGGETVDFNGPAHRLTMSGPHSAALEQDVPLRDLGETE